MKIFVVVGSMFPFDRLIKAIDKWASTRKDLDITGQIGESTFVPVHMKCFETLSSKEFNAFFSNADLIVSHAGMGVILKSLVESKPIIVLPRRLEFKELTTDHQMATARALSRMNYVNVAMDTEELVSFLEKPDAILSKRKIGEFASDDLIHTLKEFIEQN